jgi:hypothetical protein
MFFWEGGREKEINFIATALAVKQLCFAQLPLDLSEN